MIRHSRSTILFFLSVAALTLLLAACGGDEIDQGPVVKLVVGGTTYETKPYYYCWPQSEDDLRCDLNETRKVQPDKIAQVGADDEVRFVIEGGPQAPSSFVAHLLDGSQVVQNLGTGTEAVYNAEFEDGLYRVQVDVQYQDVKGQVANVSYVYGLQVAGKVAAVPTATPTVPPTPSPTAPPTNTPTLTPTAPPTQTPTATPEFSPTPASKATSTPKPLPPTVTPAAGMLVSAQALRENTGVFAGPGSDSGRIGIIQPGDDYVISGQSSEWLQLEYAESPNGLAWVPQTEVEISGDLAEIPALAPADIATIEPSVLIPQQTAVAMALNETPESTPMPIATAAPLASAVPQVTATPIPTSAGMPATATPAGSQTLPQPSPQDVPAMALNAGGRVYAPLGYRFCQRAASGERVCLELPAESGTTQRFTLARGMDAQLHIIGERPSEVTIEYLTDTGIPTGQPETRPGDNLILFIISPEAGSYIMSVRFTWPTQEVTYYLRVAITG